jgi:hypothetical protein
MPQGLSSTIAHLFAAIEDLKRLYPHKSFTLDGRLVGDIGEVLAEERYGIKLYPKQKARHDGETEDGRKVQIKATFKDSLTFTVVPDFYIGLKLRRNGTCEEVFNGPGKLIYRRWKHRKGIGKTQLSFPIDQLSKLSIEVESRSRIPTRS